MSDGTGGDSSKDVMCDLAQVGKQEGTSCAIECGKPLTHQAPRSKNETCPSQPSQEKRIIKGQRCEVGAYKTSRQRKGIMRQLNNITELCKLNLQ